MALQATKVMCFLCFEALQNETTKSKTSKVAERVIVPGDATQCPMFVTWKLNGSLRGCIGCFDDLPLWDGLQEYAVTAGTKDHRFSPISARELPQLSCAVSLLHSFEECANATDWEVGVHGIRLFVDGRRSTYLPEVAADQSWSKFETLKHLAAKGGFPGQYDEAAMARSTVKRYQSSKIAATWDEYQAFVQSL
jgi:uncharacterized protein (TIGR00296 family)